MKRITGMFLAVAAAMAYGAEWSGTQSFTEDTEVTEAVALSGEVTVEVASGKTVAISGVVSGEGASIRKTGEGTLHLSGANTFTGGCTIESGYLRASDSDSALGTGKVTILGQREGYSGRCQLDLVGDNTGANKYTPVRTFANAIDITGDSTPALPAVVFYYQNVVLTGAINAEKRFVFYDDFNTTKAVSSSQYNRYQFVCCADLQGNITAKEGVFCSGWTTVFIHGKIDAPVFNMCVRRPESATGGDSADGNGNAHMAVAVFSTDNNTVKEVVTERGYLYLAAEKVFPNALFRFQCSYVKKTGELHPNSCSTIYNRFYDYGTKQWGDNFDQTFGGFEGDELHNGDIWYGGKIIGNDTHSVELSGNRTVKIVGVPPAEGETTRRCSSSVELYGNGSPLLVDAYVGFTQVFSNRIHRLPSAEVRKGAVEFAGVAMLSSLSTLTVGTEGSFKIDSVTNGAMKALRTLSVDGEFTVAGTDADLFTRDAIALSLGRGASFTLREGETMVVKTLSVGGTTRSSGIYTPSSFAQLKRGTLIVTSGTGVEFTEAAFGEDGDLSDTTKWNTAVNLNDYSVLATFGSSGTYATVDGVIGLGGVKFESDYTLAKDDAGAGSLGLGDGGIELASGDNGPRTCVISAPTTIYGNQEWTVHTNQTLVFDNSLKDIFGTVTVFSECLSSATANDPKRGRIVFKGDNEFSGALIVTSSVVEVSGRLSAPGRVDQGNATRRGANTFTIQANTVVSGKNVGGHGYLYVSNAVIEKPLFLTYNVGDSAIRTAPNSTNLISGKMAWTSPWLGFRTADNSELIFANGFTIGWSLRTFGSASGHVRIVDLPITANVGCGWNVDQGNVSLEVAGNKINYLTSGYYDGGAKASIDFRASYATDANEVNALGCGLAWNNSYDGFQHKTSGKDEIRFHSTTQRFARVAGSTFGTMTGEKGSRLEVYNQTAIGNFKAAELFVASKIEGALSLLMGGGALCFSNQTFTTTGELEVTNGTAEVAVDATFPHLAAVRVSGKGKLQLDAAGRFGRDAELYLGDNADNWKLDLTGQQTFAFVYNSDLTRVPPGIYGGADCTVEGANKALLADHINGTGAINVRRIGGTAIIMR